MSIYIINKSEAVQTEPLTVPRLACVANARRRRLHQGGKSATPRILLVEQGRSPASQPLALLGDLVLQYMELYRLWWMASLKVQIPTH